MTDGTSLAGLRERLVDQVMATSGIRDERIAAIDLRATAVTALAMIAVVLVGFVVDIARGGTGWPWYLIGAVGGLAYIAAVAVFRIRG